MAGTKELARATGRRKEAVARVRLMPGTGNFSINEGRSLSDYFPNLAIRRVILEPLEALELTKDRKSVV
jgi:small subunit ribosomal protein S9